MKDTGITGEITIATFIDNRKIIHSFGEAEERKQYTTIMVEVHQQRGADLVKGSSQLVLLGDPGQLSEKNIEMLVEHAYRRAFWASKALETSSSDRGRKTLVLTANASSVIVKEFVRRLVHLKISELGLGKQIVSSNLTIKDDPLSTTSPSIRVFDDECVKTRRKTLVENGVLVELLGTRFNAGTISKPGNAYGLWEPPTPFYTNLHLSKGDWDEKEIIEETKEGFLVDNVASYMVRGDVLSIYPESAWRIRRGELVEPILIKEIKLPITDTLSNMDALGKSHQTSCSWEKQWLVCVESLMLRAIGHVL